MNLYISNLSKGTTTEQIRVLFSGYKNFSVSAVKTIRNAFTSATSTFAYAGVDDDVADKALSMINNCVLNGAQLKAQLAQ